MSSVAKPSVEKSNTKLYGPIASVVITVLIYILGQLMGAFILSVVIGLSRHWTVTEINNWLSLGTAWAQFWYVVCVEIVTIVLLGWFMSRRKAQPADLGLGRAKWTHILYTVLGFGAYMLLYIVTLVLAKQIFPALDLEQKQELGINTTLAGQALWPVFISLVILPPIVEEIVVRGFLFGGLRTKLNFISAAFITSGLFAAAHLPEASSGLLWVGAIDTFVLSMVLCYLREETRSLWPAIGVHMLKNGLAFMVLFSLRP